MRLYNYSIILVERKSEKIKLEKQKLKVLKVISDYIMFFHSTRYNCFIIYKKNIPIKRKSDIIIINIYKGIN